MLFIWLKIRKSIENNFYRVIKNMAQESIVCSENKSVIPPLPAAEELLILGNLNLKIPVHIRHFSIMALRTYLQHTTLNRCSPGVAASILYLSAKKHFYSISQAKLGDLFDVSRQTMYRIIMEMKIILSREFYPTANILVLGNSLPVFDETALCEQSSIKANSQILGFLSDCKIDHHRITLDIENGLGKTTKVSGHYANFRNLFTLSRSKFLKILNRSPDLFRTHFLQIYSTRLFECQFVQDTGKIKSLKCRPDHFYV
jgi:hypothetical protein